MQLETDKNLQPANLGRFVAHTKPFGWAIVATIRKYNPLNRQ